MAEWLGRLMADWPSWLVAIGVAIIGVVYACYMLVYPGPGDDLWGRYASRKRREKQLQASKRPAGGKK